MSILKGVRRFIQVQVDLLRSCWHEPGEWQPLENPDPYITTEMYQAAVIPTHIRSCKCGRVLELRLQKWENQ